MYTLHKPSQTDSICAIRNEMLKYSSWWMTCWHRKFSKRSERIRSTLISIPNRRGDNGNSHVVFAKHFDYNDKSQDWKHQRHFFTYAVCSTRSGVCIYLSPEFITTIPRKMSLESLKACHSIANSVICIRFLYRLSFFSVPTAM